ncbi:MAG: transglutaminase-like domain-containing protein [Thermoflavifilum sp.]|nr:transglutaminase-like domain-containing protein [Thermoflavifilum sp.]
MADANEINALLHLLDDPDQEVFDTVADRIVHLGKQIIPSLEHVWENTLNEAVQERIEWLIHRVHLQDLLADMRLWAQSPDNLLKGALLVDKYQYPELAEEPVWKTIEKLKRNIWLELNDYLTPVERINVMNSMLYSYWGIKGFEISEQQKNHFFLHQLLDTKRGNALSVGILYQYLCEELNIPVKAVQIPRQYILAYFEDSVWFYAQKPAAQLHIQFFIDPVQGQIYSPHDVETYLKRIDAVETDLYYEPLTHRQIIQKLLRELARCYPQDHYPNQRYELFHLAALLDD